MKHKTIEVNRDELIPEDSGDATVLDKIVSLEPAASDRITSSPLAGMIIGTFVRPDSSGRPLVDFPGNPEPLPTLARSTVETRDDQIGRSVALMFEQGDARRPLLLAFLDDSASVISTPDPGGPEKQEPAPEDEPDPERLVLTADREIVLRCGKASITLTKAGKILIRGAYLSSRSSGVNRIKGGSVQIN